MLITDPERWFSRIKNASQHKTGLSEVLECSTYKRGRERGHHYNRILFGMRLRVRSAVTWHRELPIKTVKCVVSQSTSHSVSRRGSMKKSWISTNICRLLDQAVLEWDTLFKIVHMHFWQIELEKNVTWK